ncbi:RagB/SusD family nutrient uptake outer membrane protein [Sphingobacterium pedocola]|uniref:RagB/SusD family nutrient uptake outer membrane protein n=1 Tax=Sphingobacterium pedocola TaxID=2082722 RepID=A0ABR9T897_9SPHI|nr:RagB/SusD family nutrient uptake outer membrane protein [Sphingobacterium pedocola]MBE8721553.1 RagB/SusD family nutrient uptake outer membrane protein [Sphingobacterium pedocola]
MRLYKYIVACSIILLLGCGKDFLERAPSDFIDENEVFSNLDNAEAFLNNAYTYLPDFLNKGGTGGDYNLGSGTGEGVSMWNDYTKMSVDFNNGNWNPNSFPLDYRWSQYYNAIRRVNIFLKNYELLPDEAGTQNNLLRKRRMLGEAYGLRAFYYFQLMKMWGEVPIIDRPLDSSNESDYLMGRNSVDEVVEFIKKDIDQAIIALPPRIGGAEYGRFTGLTARALLARTLLYYASPLFNPQNIAMRWEEAETAAEEAWRLSEVNGHTLSLQPLNNRQAYERIFVELNNAEVIWSRTSDSYWWDFWAESLGYGGWYGEAPIQEMVDSYEMQATGQLPVLGYNADGTVQPNPTSGYDPKSPFAGRDPRFYQSILYHGAQWKGRQIDISPGGRDYFTDRPRVNYSWRKGMLEERNLVTETGMSARRFVLFRLAELYLNYAEARNERLSDPDQHVYDAVNAIRLRAGMPNLPTGLSKEQMRERIIRERKVEFVLEGLTFWDVRRWRTAHIVDVGPVRKIYVNNQGDFTYPIWSVRVFDPSKHYFFPIPQLEIDKNPMLIQNPGW